MLDKYNLTKKENVFLAKKVLVSSIYNSAKLDCLLWRRSSIMLAFPALSISSGRIPRFSSSFFWLSDGGASSHPNAGTYPARSSACMLISNCSGSTSFFFRFRISRSCLARDSSLSAITSSDAFFSASSMSTGHPQVSSMLSVIFWATSRSVQIRSAGWHSSWRSVCHRKSKSNRCSFPGCSRVPRPTI